MKRKVSKAQVPMFEAAEVEAPAPVKFEPKPPAMGLPVVSDWRTAKPAPAAAMPNVPMTAVLWDEASDRAAMQRAIAEMLEFDPRHLPDLPLSTTLLLLLEDSSGLAMVTTSRASYNVAHSCQCPVFAGGEIEALCLAAEHERGTANELRRWCRLKMRDPHFRLTAGEVCGQLGHRIEPKHWPLSKVLNAYALRLVGAYCDEAPPGLRRVERATGHHDDKSAGDIA